MPANRLRNLDWQKSLQQVHERGGSLDVTVATEESANGDGASNILWRVRLLDLSDTNFTIEQPSTLGKGIEFDAGIELVVILTIGQNRWMFRTEVQRSLQLEHGGGRNGRRPTRGVQLSMPDHVERCQRRSNNRVSTASLSLPTVDIWPLLDPKSVVVAERANELAITDDTPADPPTPPEIQLPDVGPKFSGTLLNLGGGGVGLDVSGGESQSLLRHKLFWLRIWLPGTLEAPICATTKLVHTHMTASQDYYAGMAFDFTFNPAHQEYVVNQIGSYVAGVQRLQVLQKSA